MPSYIWMFENDLDYSDLKGKLKALRTVGVPYTDAEISNAVVSMKKQSSDIAKDLQGNGFSIESKKEIIALIAYLQRLGTDISAK